MTALSRLLGWRGTTNFHQLVNSYINKHLHSYLHDYPFRDRLSVWHWNRLAHNNTPAFWLLKHVWWAPGFRWLWRLRCRNVSWRMERYNERRATKISDLHDWSRA